MAQKYRCMSCHLQKKPSNRPLEDFGITDRKRFYADFMTQGCWRRCVSCATAKNLPMPGPAAKLRCNAAAGQDASDKATNSCIRCAEKFPGLQIQVNNHVCSGCRRNFFDPNDLYAKLKPRGSENALLCDYISNSCSTMTELKRITILLFQRLGRMIRKEPRAYPGPRSSISIGGASVMGETFEME